MIVCAAVIGQQNNPLYLQTLQQETNESSLRFHYVVHCSLDAVEERMMNPIKSTGEPSDAYLGLLYPTEEFKIYGYASNTRVKFILVVDEVMPKDEEMRLIFRRFHAAFIDAISNPFYTVNMPITSPGFDASVKTIMTTV
ncbi:hypothetical protein CVIRNUC_006511 [Coccomyxa viridis]|uniref:Trafficking protein particle complex subunit n=1 Tax=Coccomyxa viridis TaxID=1274662 RepID=A0AAV1IAT3_9CHLO|nr:hypothetical protein CVIRNUC_006511 [Coccomyxa viridis]